MANSLALHLPPSLHGVEPAVHIDVYDGPLDLLLLLIRREGVDIRDIPIARICDAYLSYLDDVEISDSSEINPEDGLGAGPSSELSGIDVNTAGDYLLLAATLCQLKAQELLPRMDAERRTETDDALSGPDGLLDPRTALVRRLLEYERYRDAAELLGQREMVDRDVYTRPAEPPERYEQPVDPSTDMFGLLRIYYELMADIASPGPIHHVQREPQSFGERARWILHRVSTGHTELWQLLQELPEPYQRIFAFLAVLEMARLHLLDIRQDGHLSTVSLAARVDQDNAALSHLPEEL